MGDEQLLRTALRVLTAYMDFKRPDPADVQQLRQHVSPPQSSWETDELACFIVQRSLAARHVVSDLDAARAEWLAAMAELNQIVSEVPTDTPHPDGKLRIQKAGARRVIAYEKYVELLRRSPPRDSGGEDH